MTRQHHAATPMLFVERCCIQSLYATSIQWTNTGHPMLSATSHDCAVLCTICMLVHLERVARKTCVLETDDDTTAIGVSQGAFR